MLRLPCVLALCLLPLLATAAPARYKLDPVHTRVMFAIEHAGFSHAMGTISGSEGELLFDPDNWADAQLDVSIPVTRLELGDDKWNKATLARNLLDGERYPQAHFVSRQIEQIDPTRANVHGLLTLRGITREVTLAVTLNAIKRHPLPPFKRTAGFSASAMISRADFGIDAWKSMIGDRVELRIEAEAVREGRADDPDEAPATDTPPETTTPEPIP